MNSANSGNTSNARSRRPHPARRARRIAGSLTIGSMLALTGGLALATHTTTASTTSATAGVTTATVASNGESDDGAILTQQRSVSTAAVAGTAATQANTSTHAS